MISQQSCRSQRRRDAPTSRRSGVYLIGTPLLLLALLAAHCARSQPGETERLLGPRNQLGEGTVRSYADVDGWGRAVGLGALLDEDALRGLPTAFSLATLGALGPCVELDGDDSFDVRSECVTGQRIVLRLPEELASEAVRPVLWMSLSWYPQGHRLPSVYNLPHFDLRFHLVGREAAEAIGHGRCGVVIDCAEFERASRTVPPPYLPQDYVDVGAALPALGNHLIDSAQPEFDGPPGALERTFIYGAYNGELVFWQVMAAHALLVGGGDGCWPVKQPAAWRVDGRYPTRFCIRRSAVPSSARRVRAT